MLSKQMGRQPFLGEDVALRGWVRVKVLLGVIGERSIRSVGSARTAIPAEKKFLKRRILELMSSSFAGVRGLVRI